MTAKEKEYNDYGNVLMGKLKEQCSFGTFEFRSYASTGFNEVDIGSYLIRFNVRIDDKTLSIFYHHFDPKKQDDDLFWRNLVLTILNDIPKAMMGKLK